MGMFDYVNFENHEYQTKDTPDQFMSTYEIRGDELWYKKVESEWVDSEKSLFGGYFEELSHEWIFYKDFDGVIEISREDEENGGYENDAWVTYKMLFMDGKIIKLERIE
jgi:hypothetical protein